MSDTDPTSPMLTREGLYERVWSQTLREVAKDIGLSDVGLAKLCRRLHIPLPGRGYWQRKASGQTVQRPSLPKGDSAEPIVIQPHRRLSQVAVRRFEDPQPEHPQVTAIIASAPHPIRADVAQTSRSLHGAKADERGLIRPRAQRTLNVRVTRPMIDRAMQVLNTLLIAIEASGARVGSDAAKAGTTLINVSGEAVGISLEEVVHRTERKLPKNRAKASLLYWRREWDYHPSGSLTLKITELLPHGLRRCWSDGKLSQLDGRLASVVRGIHAAAAALTAQRLEREQWHRDWEEEQRRAAERQRLREQEERRVHELEAALGSWRRSQEIRQFLSLVEASCAKRALTETARSQVQDWIAWAGRYADWLDPTIDSPPSILDEEPRDFLFERERAARRGRLPACFASGSSADDGDDEQ